MSLRAKKWIVSLTLAAALFGGALIVNRILLDTTFQCATVPQTDEERADCEEMDRIARENQRVQQILFPTAIIVHALEGSRGDVSGTAQRMFLYANALIYIILCEWIVSAIMGWRRRRSPPATEGQPHA